jgi:hypothetical protein
VAPARLRFAGEALAVVRFACFAENSTLSPKVLPDNGVEVSSAMLISRPYQERCSYATCRSDALLV